MQCGKGDTAFEQLFIKGSLSLPYFSQRKGGTHMWRPHDFIAKPRTVKSMLQNHNSLGHRPKTEA